MVTLHPSISKMEEPFQLLIDSYLDNKIGIDPAFISERLAKGLQLHIRQLHHDDMMTSAGIGNQAVKDSSQKIRGDKIYWLDKSHTNIFELEFMQLVEEFIRHLNQTCYTGINGYEFHFAVYEEGSFYKKHTDQFQNDNNRKFSLISYLNEDWQEEDGGQLHIHREGETQKIRPGSGKAVFFKRDEMEHEVTRAGRSRMSITGWLKQVN